MPATEPSPAKGKGKERVDDALGWSSVVAALEKFAAEKPSDEPLVAAIVGFTNVCPSTFSVLVTILSFYVQSGKSSFINSLARKPALPVYKLSSSQDGPTTTIFPQEVFLEVGSKRIRLIDTPGLSWVAPAEQPAEEATRVRARDIIIRNKGRIDRLKDPEPVGALFSTSVETLAHKLYFVVQEIASRAGRDDVMLFYNLPAFTEKDTNALLSALARVNGLIKKVRKYWLLYERSS